MTTEWVITEAAERVELDALNRGETTFTVTNPGSVPDRVVFEAVAGGGADGTWFEPVEPQRPVAGGRSESFLVRITVPPGAAPGSYWLQGRAYSADTAPEEGSRLSGRMALEVRPTAKPARPWWPYAVAAALVVVVLAVVGWLVFPRDGEPEAQPTPSVQPSPAPVSTRPELVSPAEDQILDAVPRVITFLWEAVPGATRYLLEVESCQFPGCTEQNSQPWRQEIVFANTFMTEFVGAQPGRWRVTPILPTGEGEPSEWRQFRYVA